MLWCGAFEGITTPAIEDTYPLRLGGYSRSGLAPSVLALSILWDIAEYLGHDIRRTTLEVPRRSVGTCSVTTMAFGKSQACPPSVHRFIWLPLYVHSEQLW